MKNLKKEVKIRIAAFSVTTAFVVNTVFAGAAPVYVAEDGEIQVETVEMLEVEAESEINAEEIPDEIAMLESVDEYKTSADDTNITEVTTTNLEVDDEISPEDKSVEEKIDTEKSEDSEEAAEKETEEITTNSEVDNEISPEDKSVEEKIDSEKPEDSEEAVEKETEIKAASADVLKSGCFTISDDQYPESLTMRWVINIFINSSEKTFRVERADVPGESKGTGIYILDEETGIYTMNYDNGKSCTFTTITGNEMTFTSPVFINTVRINTVDDMGNFIPYTAKIGSSIEEKTTYEDNLPSGTWSLTSECLTHVGGDHGHHPILVVDAGSKTFTIYDPDKYKSECVRGTGSVSFDTETGIYSLTYEANVAARWVGTSTQIVYNKDSNTVTYKTPVVMFSASLGYTDAAGNFIEYTAIPTPGAALYKAGENENQNVSTEGKLIGEGAVINETTMGWNDYGVKVAVGLDENNKIADMSIVEYTNTDTQATYYNMFGNRVLEEMKEKILGKTVEEVKAIGVDTIDAVTGATMTSKGIVRAVQDAVKDSSTPKEDVVIDGSYVCIKEKVSGTGALTIYTVKAIFEDGSYTVEVQTVIGENDYSNMSGSPKTSGTYTVNGNNITFEDANAASGKGPLFKTGVAAADGSIDVTGLISNFAFSDSTFTLVKSEPEDLKQPDEEPETPEDHEQPGEEPETPEDHDQPGEEPETPEDHEQPGEETEIPEKPDQPENPEEPNYQFVEGADGTVVLGSEVDYIVRVRDINGKGEFAKFVSVEIDGTVVDPANYEVSEGSVIIKFLGSFVKNLAAGEHAVTVNFTDGVVSTKLNVKNAVISPSKENSGGSSVSGINSNTGSTGRSVATGDNNSIFPYAATMLGALAIIFEGIKRKCRH